MTATITLIVIILLVIFLTAKKYKSTKMFWCLILLFSIGFVGGSVITRLLSNKKVVNNNVKTSCLQKHAIPTYISTAKFIALDSHSGYTSKVELPEMVKHIFVTALVSHDISVVFNPDSDIGKAYNTS